MSLIDTLLREIIEEIPELENKCFLDDRIKRINILLQDGTRIFIYKHYESYECCYERPVFAFMVFRNKFSIRQPGSDYYDCKFYDNFSVIDKIRSLNITPQNI